MATHSSILAWRISWTEEPGGLLHRVAKSRTHLKQLRTHASFMSSSRENRLHLQAIEVVGALRRNMSIRVIWKRHWIKSLNGSHLYPKKNRSPYLPFSSSIPLKLNHSYHALLPQLGAIIASPILLLPVGREGNQQNASLFSRSHSHPYTAWTASCSTRVAQQVITPHLVCSCGFHSCGSWKLKLSLCN